MVNQIKPDLSRRVFMQSSAMGAALLTFGVTTAGRATGSAAPNDRMRIGFIGVGGRCQEHLLSAAHMQKAGAPVEVAAVCDVFNRNRDESASKVEREVGKAPRKTGDFRDIIGDPSIDAVCIATPDHWHARQTLDALRAGKHVYCEKPMTHTVDEAIEVLKTWKQSGKVMQVGVQSTSLPVWSAMHQRICDGMLGKVLQYQTEVFRNSDMGQWRYYELTSEMTPANIDWKMFLGTEFGLAPEMPFDRALFKQWRCYWPFGSGLFTDLFGTARHRCFWGRAFAFLHAW